MKIVWGSKSFFVRMALYSWHSIWRRRHKGIMLNEVSGVSLSQMASKIINQSNPDLGGIVGRGFFGRGGVADPSNVGSTVKREARRRKE